MILNYRCQWQL